jgi:small subunit ribosomal protein S16
MLMIRLQRIGRRNDPSFRVVVNEKAAGPKTGKFVESLGHYDPRLGKGKDLVIEADRVKYWLSVGAQCSGTIHNRLVREGIITGKARDVRPFKVIKKKEEPKEEAKQETKTENKTEPKPEAPAETPSEPAREATSEVATEA